MGILRAGQENKSLAKGRRKFYGAERERTDKKIPDKAVPVPGGISRKGIRDEADDFKLGNWQYLCLCGLDGMRISLLESFL